MSCKRMTVMLKTYGRVLESFNARNGCFDNKVRWIVTSATKNYEKKLSYFHCTDGTHYTDSSFSDILNFAENLHGDSIAVVDRNQNIQKTFSEYKKDIYNLATGLLALDLNKGDRIAIWSPNRYEWVVTQYAAAIAGLILVTLNPAYQASEFEYCIQQLKIRALVAPKSFKTQNYYNIITSVVKELPNSKLGQIRSTRHPCFHFLIMMTDEKLPGTLRFHDVMNAGGSEAEANLKRRQAENQLEDAVIILFTSGTTGRPKGATLSNFGVINSATSLARINGYFEEPTRICCNPPLFHVMGCIGAGTAALVSHSGLVFPAESFIPKESLAAIEETKCTSIYGTPTMYLDMMNHPKFEETDFSSVTRGIIGGAMCQPTILSTIMEKMHCPGLCNGYGVTELTTLVSIHAPNDSEQSKIKNEGRIIPNTEVKIVDHRGNIVPIDQPGEICVRGGQMMIGYWNDELKTKEVIKNGWYYTGDIGILNKDGYITLSGRLKDMIIRGGENIYPKEIEDFLITHPEISEVHVFGVPDFRMGEEICAWIKCRRENTLTELDLRNFCKGKISHFKIPRYIRFVNHFPKTGSGKVQKYKMREEMELMLKNQDVAYLRQTVG